MDETDAHGGVSASGSDDEHLLQRWRDGDKRAGQVLFNRYYDMLERFFANKVATGIDDLVQEVFMHCTAARERVERFRPFLFGVARNVLNIHLRQKYRAGRVFEFAEVSVRDLLPGPSTVMARRQEHRLLLEGLRSIPLEYQIVLELYYWEDMNTDAIAELLSVAPSTLRSRLQRARALLAQAMERLVLDPASLAATLTRLDDWARGCRAYLP